MSLQIKEEDFRWNIFPTSDSTIGVQQSLEEILPTQAADELKPAIFSKTLQTSIHLSMSPHICML